MTFLRVLEPLEQRIVGCLQDRIPYLAEANGGTCLGVVDFEEARGFLELTPPIVLVMAGPEVDEDPTQIGGGTVLTHGGGNQYTRQYWRVMPIARQLKGIGDGRLDGHGWPGLYSMLDDIDGALRGFNLGTFQRIARMYKSGQSDPSNWQNAATAVSTWWHRWHREEQA